MLNYINGALCHLHTYLNFNAAQVIRHAVLPIGKLPEIAAEVCNRNFRQYRLKFSGKFTRSEYCMDIFNRLLLTLDSY